MINNSAVRYSVEMTGSNTRDTADRLDIVQRSLEDMSSKFAQQVVCFGPSSEKATCDGSNSGRLSKPAM